jgi:hypothetical protein
MKSNQHGIVPDGQQRLLAAIAAQVRREYQAQLTTAHGLQKAAIEAAISREIRARQKRMVSPYALWGAR